MLRTPHTNTPRFPAVIVLALASIAGAGFAACSEEPTVPGTREEERLLPGLNVYLTLDDAAASPGSVVRVTAKLRAVDVRLTPTGYVVQMWYDPKKLEPLEAVEIERDGLHVINLEAGPGRVKAAGAAASGFDSNALFGLAMKVKAASYADDLAIEVLELDIVERGFADIAADVVVQPRAIVVP